jgi:hypothetical protein
VKQVYEMKPSQEKHQPNLPSARKIRRTCKKELQRAIKKLKVWISPEKYIQAEELYVKRVVLNLLWISENGSNRKKLADWWVENCCADIAEIWEVDKERLAIAFRDSFGG